MTGRERLRVLVVQPYAQLGGSESWLLRLLDATDELDARVLLLRDGPLRPQLEARGIEVEVWPVGRNPLSIVAPAARLARRLRRDRPDVVLGNVLKGELVAGPAGRLAGVPTVWGKHDHGHDRLLARPVGRLAHRVVAAADELAAPTGRPDAVVIPPPRPDREPAGREEARAHLRNLGIPLGDDPVVLMAGRLVPFKGIDDMARALALAPARSWRCVVAGDDDDAAAGETARLRALAAQLGVEDRMHFAGHVDGVSHWMAGFDALAVLTKPTADRRAPAQEGFGTSAFEAMLAGVPVIATAGGAVANRLAGRAGIAVPPGAPSAVAAALGTLEPPAVRAAMGAAGRDLVAAHPDARACASALVAVLRDAAAQHSGRRSALPSLTVLPGGRRGP